VRLVQACKAAGVPKMVMTSTPSARFDPWNLDIRGKKEEVQYMAGNKAGEVLLACWWPASLTNRMSTL